MMADTLILLTMPPLPNRIHEGFYIPILFIFQTPFQPYGEDNIKPIPIRLGTKIFTPTFMPKAGIKATISL